MEGGVWNNTVTVLEYNSLTIDIGTFPGAYQMYLVFPGFESYDWSYSWIVPRVGLVKMDFHDGRSDGVTITWRDEYWELIWYNLVE